MGFTLIKTDALKEMMGTYLVDIGLIVMYFSISGLQNWSQTSSCVS